MIVVEGMLMDRLRLVSVLFSFRMGCLDGDSCGIRIRSGVVDTGDTASTVIPVLLGDRGDAIIGEGIVCLFRYFGVLVIPVVEVKLVVTGRSSKAC